MKKITRFVFALILSASLLQACSATSGTPTCNICTGDQNPNIVYNFLSQFVGK